jgi:tetratricopeptide (TPR) repeat protein
MLQEQPLPGQQTASPRATADRLRKAGQFAEAAVVYASTWPDGDPWTGWAYALCLRKIGKCEEAVSVAKTALDLNPDSQFVRSVYAWALFDTIRKAEELSAELLERAELLVALSAESTTAYENVSPFVPAILLVARLLAAKGRFNQALHWLQLLDPARLSQQEFAIQDPTGRHRRLASHRERFHGIKTHALEKLGQWCECLAAAESALSECSPLHYDNDIWFARRAARAKIRLGQSAQGIAELETLVARKPASFIYFDIADAAWEVRDKERAFKNCLLALKCPGEIAFKLPAVLLFGRILWDQGKRDEARSHLMLYCRYREGKGWKISSDVRSMLAEWGAESTVPDTGHLVFQLQSLWREMANLVDVRRTGVVQSLLPHGRAGFIVADERERFYFETRDWKAKRGRLTKGSRVSFNTKPSYDRKRQRATVVACDIRED